MTSKIDAYTNSAAANVGSAQKPAGSVSASASAGSAKIAAAPSVDTVKLTSDAQQMHHLEKAIVAVPVVDQARVQKVRQSLASGSYRIDSRAIAAKLSNAEWSLGNS